MIGESDESPSMMLFWDAVSLVSYLLNVFPIRILQVNLE